MIPIHLTEQQLERMRLANKLKKYGHLKTWEELLFFQYMIATHSQKLEIAEYAARNNRGEHIILPLKFQAEKDTPQPTLPLEV